MTKSENTSVKLSRTYHTDGKGRWWLSEIKFIRQCGKAKGMLWLYKLKCQGKKGHKGNCWAYRPDGWLIETLPDGGGQSTPPEHDAYINPIKKQQLCYNSPISKTFTEITDSAELAKLNSDEDYSVRKGYSCIRPVSLEDWKEINETK